MLHSWSRHFTLITVPLSIQEYKINWYQQTVMTEMLWMGGGGCNLRWTSIPSRGSSSSPSQLHATETGVSSGSVGQFGLSAALPDRSLDLKPLYIAATFSVFQSYNICLTFLIVSRCIYNPWKGSTFQHEILCRTQRNYTNVHRIKNLKLNKNNRPFPSCLLPLFQNKCRCDQNSFSHERFCTRTRFETEVKQTP